MDAARRLMGEAVSMTVPTERKGLMDRLLGRRAA
jgi:septum site-determining protein MinD